LPAPELEAAGHRGDALDEHVVEEGYPALDRGGHAHLVLLHQELDEVGLQIRAAHPIEVTAGRRRVALERRRGRIARGEEAGIGEEVLLEPGRKRREVLAEDVPGAGRQAEERAGRVATESPRQAPERSADGPAQARWRQPVRAAEPVVPVGDPVAVIAEE